MHYELFTKSFYGKTVELAIVFNPVDMPSEKETAEVAKIWSDVDSNYISAGVMSAEEVRDVRRSQDDSPYSALADEMEGAPDEELNQAADEALDKDYDDDIIGWAYSKKTGKPFPIRRTDKWSAEGDFKKPFYELKEGEKTGRKFCGYEEIWLDNYSDVDTAFRNDKKAWKSKNRIYKKEINGIIYTGIKDDDNLWYYIDKEYKNGKES